MTPTQKVIDSARRTWNNRLPNPHDERYQLVRREVLDALKKALDELDLEESLFDDNYAAV